MNKKGFTVVELLAAFTLTMIIVVFLFEIVMHVKDVYMTSSIKSQVTEKNGVIATELNNKLEDTSNAEITKCENFISLNKNEENKININVGGKTISLPDNTSIDSYNCSIGDLNISNTNAEDNKYINVQFIIKSPYLKKDIDFKYIYTFGSGSHLAVKTYKLTFDYNTNGGIKNSSTDPNEIQVNSTTKITNFPKATKEGWKFVGWNTDKDAQEGLSSYKMPASNITLYAIYKKEAVTLTANFNANGATLSSTASKTCTIPVVYNNNTQGSSCTVNAPTITRDGYTIIGFNTSDSSTTNNSSYNASTKKIDISENSTWYAITKNNTAFTANWNANGATLSSTAKKSCNPYNTATTCTVDAPTITRTGYNILGFNTSANSKSNNSNYNVSTKKLTISENRTWYAITEKNTAFTATFNKNGATSIGKDKLSCTIYNKATTCTVKAPSITRPEFTITGWNTNQNATASTSGTVAVNNNITLSSNATWYAITSKNVTVAFDKGTHTTSIGATSGNCTIKNNNTSCPVLAPSITPENNYISSGWSTQKDASTGIFSNNNLQVSQNETYYGNSVDGTPSFSKTDTQTGANIIISFPYGCGSEYTCKYKKNSGSEVNVTTSTVTVPFNASGNLVATVNKDSTQFSASYSYTRIVKATLAKGDNVSSIGSTSVSCEVVTGTTSCQVTLPTITPASHYTVLGWYNGDAVVGKASDSISLNTNVNYTAKSRLNQLKIKYHMNGGSWMGSTNTRISYSGDFVTLDSDPVIQTINYGANVNLYDYNNPDAMNISKPGYVAKAGSQWCTSTAATTCFNHSTDYKAEEISSDLANSDQTITLYANWVHSTNLYVSNSGNDTTGHGTIVNPYKTITKAYDMASTAATNIYIMSNLTQTATTTMGNNKNITLTSCTQNGNSCKYSNVYTVTRGSALVASMINNSSGTLNLTNITIDGNNIEATKEMITNAGTLNIKSGATLTKGFNKNGSGGAINSSGTLNITSGTISNNKARFGGAFITTSTATTTISGGIISGNSTTEGSGGAIYDQGTITMSGGSIKNNTAKTYGAGLMCKKTCTITGGTITTNQAEIADGGGGVRVDGTLTINGGSIKDNKVSGALNSNFSINGTVVDKKPNITIQNKNYRIVINKNTKYAVNVAEGKTTNGTNVQLWQTGTNDSWKILPWKDDNGTVTYIIQSQITKKQYLWIDGNSTTPQANVVTWEFHGSQGGYWHIKASDVSGAYYFQNIGGLCLDLADQNVANGTNIQSYTCNNTAAQKWKLALVS